MAVPFCAPTTGHEWTDTLIEPVPEYAIGIVPTDVDWPPGSDTPNTTVVGNAPDLDTMDTT